MATTKPIALINTIISTIAGTSAITTYCTTNLGAALKYFIGIDDGILPPDTSLPYIDFRIGNYTIDPDRASRTVVINMALCISKSGSTVVGSTTMMDGLQALEDLHFLIEAALESVFSGSSYNYQVFYGNQTTEAATPLYRLSWSLTFQGNV